MSPRILLVQQEWHREFRRSTQWSYISSLGYVDALRNVGADVTLLTTPWISLARQWILPGDFDQVWLIDLVHLDPPDGFFDWIAALAPVRVGLVGESLRYTPDEIRDVPQLATRAREVDVRGRFVTHMFFVDEVDARDATARGCSALWLPPAMLRDLVIPADRVAPKGPVGFIGELYPKRLRFFSDPRIVARVARIEPNDRTGDVEARYLETAELVSAARAAPPREQPALHHAYDDALLAIRREIFARYLAAFAGLGATINPPSFVKAYPGRVFEAMARGVPVLSARLTGRPGADRLFVEGDEIGLFDATDVEALCALIDDLEADPEGARQLALRARERLLADHTLESRCALALRFLEASPA